MVLELRNEAPLDLVDYLEKLVAEAPPTYVTRQARWHDGNPARRVCAVIPRNASLTEEYVAHLMEEIPVFQDLSLAQARERAPSLGESGPGARIDDADLRKDTQALASLAEHADPEAVAFASRSVEQWWTDTALGYADVL